MTENPTPNAPCRVLPGPDDEHYQLYKDVREAISSLPIYFRCAASSTYWRQFLRAFQESTTDAEVRSALEQLRRRIQHATDLPSPKAQSAIAIIAELERLLDIGE